MIIDKVTDQRKHDFTAIFKCEHCGCTYTSMGFDDNEYHENIVPNMKCRCCGKSQQDEVEEYGYLCDDWSYFAGTD